ncbi:MAG: polysaccharide pyruvyl transferase family protein [Anaerohalosphaera sp.]|nr:polysaccharide pyruvyl transferase family protein [Anaerohalosphaera sp.]
MSESTKKNDRLTVLISGSSLSSNKGAMAMTLVLAQQMRKRDPDCKLRLLSKYPDQDILAAQRLDIELVHAKPSSVVTFTLLRSILAAMIKPLPNRWLYNDMIRAYEDADILVDMGGVTFSDDRDWRGLLLSIGWLMPAVATNTSFVKLSQALGPFKKPMNNIFAKFLLKRASLVIARGKGTSQNLDKLIPGGITHHLCTDVAFLLEPAAADEIDHYLSSNDLPQNNFIGISPSAVVDRKAKAKGIGQLYRNSLKHLVEHVRTTTDRPVMLVPHAWPQSGKGREDMELCCDIYDELDSFDNVFVIKDNLDAALLKGIIARSEVFIACRFHAMIAALSSNVPVQVVGWGHKYNEIMELFRMEKFCCDFTSATPQDLARSFDEMWQTRQDLNTTITDNLEQVRQSSAQNFHLLENLLTEKGLL